MGRFTFTCSAGTQPRKPQPFRFSPEVVVPDRFPESFAVVSRTALAVMPVLLDTCQCPARAGSTDWARDTPAVNVATSNAPAEATDRMKRLMLVPSMWRRG